MLRLIGVYLRSSAVPARYGSYDLDVVACRLVSWVPSFLNDSVVKNRFPPPPPPPPQTRLLRTHRSMHAERT